ncbi:hypothetical protein QR680_006067 [Steinernema hermaphroditum]|uniref:Uncharacterized protein n=1 Tax=Steinernema hermaphroditum TaxID=289476 RepID=A0AA39LWR5_9BILA|nr:hypothetical protein QR680_006067 [Steinernema hermaphroditum]
MTLFRSLVIPKEIFAMDVVTVPEEEVGSDWGTRGPTRNQLNDRFNETSTGLTSFEALAERIRVLTAFRCHALIGKTTSPLSAL